MPRYLFSQHNRLTQERDHHADSYAVAHKVLGEGGGSRFFGIVAVAMELGLTQADDKGESFGAQSSKYIVDDDPRLVLAGSMYVAGAASHGTASHRAGSMYVAGAASHGTVSHRGHARLCLDTKAHACPDLLASDCTPTTGWHAPVHASPHTRTAHAHFHSRTCMMLRAQLHTRVISCMIALHTSACAYGCACARVPTLHSHCECAAGVSYKLVTLLLRTAQACECT